jgi:GT2 family glycosyltransferase
MNPTFSVVIPIYNRSEFLAETLASVHAQTISPVEILVVDDGSGDKEAKIISPIVDEAGAKFSRQMPVRVSLEIGGLRKPWVVTWSSWTRMI